MPCIFVLIAFMAPRFVIVVLWLFSSWFSGLFDGPLWPVLGFFFAPMTMLWYTVVQNWFGGEWTLLTVLGMVLAISIDLSPASGRRRRVD